MGEPSNTHSDCPPLLTVQLPPPSPPPPPPQEFTQTGRPQRNYTLPRRYQDILPVPPLPPALEDEPEAPQTSLLPRVRLIVRDRLVTALNAFGLWRDYPHQPSYDPDMLLSTNDLSEPHLTFENAPQASLFGYLSQAPPWPFKNMSTWLFMNYFNSGSATKSATEANRLVHDSIEIDIPSGKKDVPSTKFAVPGLLYCKLTSVIEAAFHDPLAHYYHLYPFKLFHRSPSTGQEERVMGEIYTSDAFIHEHDLVQRRSPVPPDDPGCKREKVVVAVMFSSDGTHLANFGTAKAWPIYFMVGNLSKYFHGLPNSGAMHHLAYIPSVSL
ncbi:hypothetical protein H0H81_002553 [Sphagnurus paluster]|uniref:Uncharacterized protein n=1 Tax=Sphagnurus paluster TaxID=117069 RepID=A0A9P7FP16_9AGAR|nr:hypothetical protein H0H81_002553 [Sphagnurus paluster]